MRLDQCPTNSFDGARGLERVRVIIRKRAKEWSDRFEPIDMSALGGTLDGRRSASELLTASPTGHASAECDARGGADCDEADARAT